MSYNYESLFLFILEEQFTKQVDPVWKALQLSVYARPAWPSTCVLANTSDLPSRMRPTSAFLVAQSWLYFTSPLPLLVPKQQPLLVYLCVFALWFSSEQYSPRPSGEWLWGLFIQTSTEAMKSLPVIYVSSWKGYWFQEVLDQLRYLSSSTPQNIICPDF